MNTSTTRSNCSVQVFTNDDTLAPVAGSACYGLGVIVAIIWLKSIFKDIVVRTDKKWTIFRILGAWVRFLVIIKYLHFHLYSAPFP